MLHFKGCRLARMSSGRYCVIRELGLVKGGKGMKHHDVVLTLTPKGLCAGLLGMANAVIASSRDKFRGSHAGSEAEAGSVLRVGVARK